MKSKDIQLAEASMDAFIAASIARFQETGEMQHLYKLDDEEIKEATNRERIKEEVRESYLKYFTGAGVSATYTPAFKMIHVHVDLETFPLKADQARAFIKAQEFRKK